MDVIVSMANNTKSNKAKALPPIPNAATMLPNGEIVRGGLTREEKVVVRKVVEKYRKLR